MIRAFTIFVAVTALGLAAAWLADRPGEIVLDWQGWRVEMNLLVLAVALFAAGGALLFGWTLLLRLFGSPAAAVRYFRDRRRERGVRALSRGMIAAGAGDARLTRHFAGEARKLMRAEPLTLFLEALSAQLSGDRAAVRKAFEEMARTPESELLGLRGLFLEAQRAGDAHAARFHAESAAARAPGLKWAGNALLEFQTREGDWAAALATVERNADNRLADKKAARRTRAVLLTAQAMEREETDAAAALALAQDAHKLAPELVPAAVIAGRLAAAAGNRCQATRILEKTWKLAPHPDLAEVYAHARPGDSAHDQLKRVRALAARTLDDREGKLAVAVAAIEAREWTVAREALKPLAGSPTRRVCLLMADIEEGEHGDAGRVREWLSCAVRAPRDPAWIADGYVSEHWAPVSPVSGRIDAFEWKAPLEAITADGSTAPTEEAVSGLVVAPEEMDAAPATVKAPAPESKASTEPGETLAETRPTADKDATPAALLLSEAPAKPAAPASPLPSQTNEARTGDGPDEASETDSCKQYDSSRWTGWSAP
jgi:HemY protein